MTQKGDFWIDVGNSPSNEAILEVIAIATIPEEVVLEPNLKTLSVKIKVAHPDCHLILTGWKEMEQRDAEFALDLAKCLDLSEIDWTYEID